MLHLKCCVLYMAGFMFLTTDSGTVIGNSLSHAQGDGDHAAHTSYKAKINYSSVQHEFPRSTDDEDWSVARHQILTSTLDLLSNVSSVEDILKLGLKDSDGKPLTAEDLSAVYDNKTDKLLINGNGEVAKAANCALREVLMNVEVSELPANTYIAPKCIKVFQCGGCCNALSVACVPVASKRVVYNLLKVTVERSDRTARMTGVYPLEVTEHTACSCRCSLTQESCGPLKIFDERICQCYCKKHVRCDPPHYFNPETCNCECAQQPVCCPGRRDCGISFNETTCDCQINDKMYIASINQNQNPRHNDLSQVAEGDHARQPQTTPRMFQDTRGRPSDSCLGVACPSMLVKRINSEGRCVCTARQDSRFRGLK